MPQAIRSGRVSKAHGSQAGAPQPAAAAKAKPRGKSIRSRAQDGERRITNQKAPRTARKFRVKVNAQPQQPTPSGARLPAQPKVTRIPNDLSPCTSASLAFVHDSRLATSADTETIALNMMDHIIKPENWNESLSWNVFSASCFFFASIVTGVNNSAEDVAHAVKADEGWIRQVVLRDEMVRQRVRKALGVTREDVLRGYGIIWRQRRGLGECLGGYREGLERLPGVQDGKVSGGGSTLTVPDVGERGVFKTDALGVAEPLPLQAAEEKVSKNALDDVELDEFDTFVADNE